MEKHIDSIMKKKLLSILAFGALMIGQFSMVSAQAPCTPNSAYTSEGIYPSDTLQDMNIDILTEQVIDFVLPNDTVIMGYTVKFDSFFLARVSGIPPGLDWRCNANHPTCKYVATPPNPTRGCVTFSGTPVVISAAYPGYDTIMVKVVGYATMPPIGSLSDSLAIPVYYRISNTVSANSPLANAGLSIVPNPVLGRANVSYTLASDANVKMTVIDLMGRQVGVLCDGIQRQGVQEIMLDSREFANGSYFLKMSINDGEFVQTKKFTSIR
jgi:Secretion system C-terminal sorting domain